MLPAARTRNWPYVCDTYRGRGFSVHILYYYNQSAYRRDAVTAAVRDLIRSHMYSIYIAIYIYNATGATLMNINVFFLMLCHMPIYNIYYDKL